MFANNPMGLVVKGMMEELREEGEISSPGWQDWLRERATKVVHALQDGHEQNTDTRRSELNDLTPIETC